MCSKLENDEKKNVMYDLSTTFVHCIWLSGWKREDIFHLVLWLNKFGLVFVSLDYRITRLALLYTVHTLGH